MTKSCSKAKKKSRSQSTATSSNQTIGSSGAIASGTATTPPTPPPEIDEFLIGKLRENGYQLHQLLGEGTYSRVYRASSIKNPDQNYACKLYKINKSTLKWIKRCLDREIEISMMVKHRNIVESFCAFRSEVEAFLVLQFASNGSVRDYLKRQPADCYIEEDRVRCWLSDIFSAVAYLHGKEVAHRDIKTENFLFDDEMKPLLCDFSFACFSPNETTRYECMVDTICGTTLYLAPEVHSCTSGQKYNAKLADIYALGVCMFEMIAKQLPFHGKYGLGDLTLVARQQKRDYTFPSKIRFSNEGRQLLEQLLNPYPSSRITINRALHDPWFLMRPSSSSHSAPRSVSSSSSHRNRHRSSFCSSSSSGSKSSTGSNRRQSLANTSTSSSSAGAFSSSVSSKSGQPNSSISTCLNAKADGGGGGSLSSEAKSLAKSIDSRLGNNNRKRPQSGH